MPPTDPVSDADVKGLIETMNASPEAGDVACTWAELKSKMEAAGVQDDDKILWIDLGSYPMAKDLHIHFSDESTGRHFTISE